MSKLRCRPETAAVGAAALGIGILAARLFSFRVLCVLEALALIAAGLLCLIGGAV